MQNGAHKSFMTTSLLFKWPLIFKISSVICHPWLAVVGIGFDKIELVASLGTLIGKPKVFIAIEQYSLWASNPFDQLTTFESCKINSDDLAVAADIILRSWNVVNTIVIVISDSDNQVVLAVKCHSSAGVVRINGHLLRGADFGGKGN